MNYQKELDKILEDLSKSGLPRKLLVHSCCAPCSSYVLEYLSNYFEITVYYYNPNIYPEEEYNRRVEEQQGLIRSLPTRYPVLFRQGEYKPGDFYDSIKGFEKEPEGGERCFLCYRLRLRDAAELAKQEGYDYFTTTLSISPHKNAEKLNAIGKEMTAEYGVENLPSDFKKKNGYRRSIELSREYGLYRQDYCGCVFSKQERAMTLSNHRA